MSCLLSVPTLVGGILSFTGAREALEFCDNGAFVGPAEGEPVGVCFALGIPTFLDVFLASAFAFFSCSSLSLCRRSCSSRVPTFKVIRFTAEVNWSTSPGRTSPDPSDWFSGVASMFCEFDPIFDDADPFGEATLAAESTGVEGAVRDALLVGKRGFRPLTAF